MIHTCFEQNKREIWVGAFILLFSIFPLKNLSEKTVVSVQNASHLYYCCGNLTAWYFSLSLNFAPKYGWPMILWLCSILSSILSGGAYFKLLLLLGQQHQAERNSTSRMLIFQPFAINHKPLVAPKTGYLSTTQLYSRIEELLAPAIPELLNFGLKLQTQRRVYWRWT